MGTSKDPLDIFGSEVRSLHEFFNAWFNDGTTAGLSMQDLARRLHNDFWLISPRGERVDRSETLQLIESLGATSNPGIRVHSFDVDLVTEDMIVGTYIEEHTGVEPMTSRFSTAGLIASDRSPTGWVWRFVHETWKPGSEPG